MFRRKRKRYEYYFMKKSIYHDGWPNPKETSFPAKRAYGAFGNLGSQGWRYIGMVDEMYAFEKESIW